MDTTFRDDVKAILDEMLGDVPGITIGKAFGFPAYKTGKKVFAFIGDKGVAIKLPAARVKALIAEDEAMQPFEPVEGKIWREWVSIDRAKADDYQNDRVLFDEAIAFVTA